MARRKTTPKKAKTRAAAPPKRAARPPVEDLERAVRTLERRLKHLAAEHEALIEKHGRQLANVKRGADRRVASMMREITTLRHFEARATAMERLLAERDAVIAALRAREAAPLTGPVAPLATV